MEDVSTFSLGIFIVVVSLLAVAIVAFVMYRVNKSKKQKALRDYQRKVSESSRQVRHEAAQKAAEEEKIEKILTDNKGEVERTSPNAEKSKIVEMSGKLEKQETDIIDESSRKPKLKRMPDNIKFMKYTSEGYKPAKGDKDFEKAIWN